MNWEMIGAAGVIATLTYLARQVRTSNRATRRAGVRELLDQSLRSDTGCAINSSGSSNASSSVPTKSPRARMRMEPALCIIPMEL